MAHGAHERECGSANQYNGMGEVFFCGSGVLFIKFQSKVVLVVSQLPPNYRILEIVGPSFFWPHHYAALRPQLGFSKKIHIYIYVRVYVYIYI